MRKGSIFVAMSGKRKGTARYCPPCAAWHPTARGLGEPGCPAETTFLAQLGALQVRRARRTPAFIPADHLGTQRRWASKVQLHLTGPAEAAD